MPAHAPDTVTDPEERDLYRQISRVFEDYCGEDEEQGPVREASFLNILNLIREKLNGSGGGGARG